MPNLSAEGNQFVQSRAQRHGISTDGATHMLISAQSQAADVIGAGNILFVPAPTTNSWPSELESS